MWKECFKNEKIDKAIEEIKHLYSMQHISYDTYTEIEYLLSEQKEIE